MKKLLMVLLAGVLVATFAVGCSGGDDGDANGDAAPEENGDAVEENGDDTGAEYEDGVYFAQDEISDSWTYFVVVEVEGGEFLDAHWGG
ncbi:MAG TPA: FMN-binding protein, partial [Eubacteriaceae bacterium]|nr:FMN-binding protein [Eubacteriaceae bacterium]